MRNKLYCVILICLLLIGSTQAQVYVGITAPSSPVAGDLWSDTGAGKLKRYSGTAWETIEGVAAGATFITQTSNDTLSAEQAMGALATGLVINATATGVQSIYGGTSCANQFPRSFNTSGVASCATVDDASVDNTITLDNLTQVTARAISDTTGTLPVNRGGTNLTAAADDNVIVGNGTTWETKAVPDCDAASTAKLLYDVTTNAFSCGADQGGSGASVTRISGSSGAAGADLTWQRLSVDCAANATTTLATCMTTTSVGAGTWSFKYKVIYQAAATSTGVDFAINHTGTVTTFVGSSWFATSGGAAATALGDQVGSNTASLAEAKSARAINTKFGSTLGVDTLNANMLYVIEGTIVVSVTGSLELKHASELAASTQVRADTTLELHKVN